MAMVKGRKNSACEIFMMEIECADREEMGKLFYTLIISIPAEQASTLISQRHLGSYISRVVDRVCPVRGRPMQVTLCTEDVLVDDEKLSLKRRFLLDGIGCNAYYCSGK